MAEILQFFLVIGVLWALPMGISFYCGFHAGMQHAERKLKEFEHLK